MSEFALTEYNRVIALARAARDATSEDERLTVGVAAAFFYGLPRANQVLSKLEHALQVADDWLANGRQTPLPAVPTASVREYCAYMTFVLVKMPAGDEISPTADQAITNVVEMLCADSELPADEFLALIDQHGLGIRIEISTLH
jgi:phage gp36-like protein